MNRCILCWQAALVLHILCCKIHGSFIQCLGHIRIEPASVFLVGSNVSINCTSMVGCEPGTLHLHLNENEYKLDQEYRTTVQIQLHDVRESYDVYCSIKCADNPKGILVCGDNMKAGYPPESPTNLMCFLYERSYNMTCTWETGKYTRIKTTYTVNLTSSQAQEYIFHANRNFTIAINKSHEDAQYSLVIHAENDLGKAVSTALKIHLNDIVIPAPPVIMKAEFLNSLSPNIVVQWNNRSTLKEIYCEMRFKSASNQTWTLVNGLIRDSSMAKRLQVGHTFEADTNYEFQVHCRYIHDTRYWSTWSEFFNITTPEAEPSAAPEAWRYVGPIFTNGSKEVTVLIKPPHPKSRNGQILGYKVFYEDQGEERRLKICKPWELRCRTIIPNGVHKIFVTAFNSKGHSNPANVIVKEEEYKWSDCPPPRNMKIVSTNQTAITVTWEAPEGDATLWYVIEWIPRMCSSHQQYLLWKRISANTSSIPIQENLMSGVGVNISLYAVCMKTVSTPCIGHGFPVELKPEMGPTVLLPKTDGENVLLEWEKIPACKQGGVIVKYTIYLTNSSQNSETQYIVNSSRRMRWLDKLNPDTFYTVYVRASTTAGEGPPGNIVGFKLDINNDKVEIWLSTIFAAIILTLFIFILMSRKKIRASMKSLLISWLPIWLREKVPNAENSTAIKVLQKKEGFITTSSLLLPVYSEPLITEIRDTLQQEELQLPENQGKNEEVPCPGHLQDAASMEDSGSQLPSLADGYKPQISTGSESETTPLALSLHNSEGDGNDPISDTSHLFLAYDVCTWSSITNSRDAESVNVRPFACVNNNNLSMEYERESLLLCGTSQEGILLPGALTWHLKATHGEHSKTKSYFPQIFEK